MPRPPLPVPPLPTPGAVTAEPFGTLSDGRPVTQYTLRSGAARAHLIDYGAALSGLEVPDRHGDLANVVLGFADPAGYERTTTFSGAVVGRYANRIAGGRFTLDGHPCELPRNDGPNHLHGGPDGFHRRLWTAQPGAAGAAELTFRLVSQDGDQGYPARLEVSVRYRLTAGDDGWVRLELGYTATNTEPPGGPATVVSLTNHAYLNLGGEGSGSVEDHLVTIDAARYLPVDRTLIPLGEPADVAGTPMDFRHPTAIGARLRAGTEQLARAHGYDHTWVLDGPAPHDTAPHNTGLDNTGLHNTGLHRALRAEHPASGRVLEVRTDRPGLQFYTTNFFDGSEVGTSGRAYRQTDAFAAETQAFPDSPNRPSYPSTVLRQGATVRTTTEFAFGVTGAQA